MSSSTANGESPGLGALTLTEAFRARALLGIEGVSTAASMDEVLLRFQAVVGNRFTAPTQSPLGGTKECLFAGTATLTG